MRKIEPNREIILRWADQIPAAYDQIFLPAEFPLAATKNLRPQKVRKKREHWGLQERTWYTYTLNQAHSRVILPAGAIERLPAAQFKLLLKIQRRIGNPAVLPSKHLPAKLRNTGQFTWITAKKFRGLTANEKYQTVRAWTRTHKLTGIYPRISINDLPKEARDLLHKRRLRSLINTFAPHSGPNCFSAIAFSLEGKHLDTWMHAPPLLRILKKNGLKPQKGKPEPGDIFLCRQKGSPVHAALCLGTFVFEKPGQDFYEPYRLAGLRNWYKDWSHTHIEIWRQP